MRLPLVLAVLVASLLVAGCLAPRAAPTATPTPVPQVISGVGTPTPAPTPTPTPAPVLSACASPNECLRPVDAGRRSCTLVSGEMTLCPKAAPAGPGQPEELQYCYSCPPEGATPTPLVKEYRCQDGTPQNECSTVSPGRYCSVYLNLQYDCKRCGCPAGQTCTDFNLCR